MRATKGDRWQLEYILDSQEIRTLKPVAVEYSPDFQFVWTQMITQLIFDTCVKITPSKSHIFAESKAY